MSDEPKRVPYEEDIDRLVQRFADRLAPDDLEQLHDEISFLLIACLGEARNRIYAREIARTPKRQREQACDKMTRELEQLLLARNEVEALLGAKMSAAPSYIKTDIDYRIWRKKLLYQLNTVQHEYRELKMLRYDVLKGYVDIPDKYKD